MKTKYLIIGLALLTTSIAHAQITSCSDCGTYITQQAQLSDALNCRGCVKLPSEIRRADKLLLKYQTQSIETAEEIEDLIFALELAGTPYQAAHILEYEMNVGRMARSLENYLRLSDLYQYAREDGHALSVLAAGLERFTRDNPLYGKLLESHDSLRKNIEANDPEVIRAEFRKRSHGVISKWSLERELCFVKIKQAYDDEDFIGQFNLKDEACQKYKAEYDQKYRMAYTPMQKD